jgi:hypothetical protein
MSRIVRAALLAVSILALAEAQAAISFGARTQIWPFMFAKDERSYSADERIKRDVALGNLDRYDELGVRWNIVDVWQEIDGPDRFRRLDRVAAEHEKRGIQMALRVLERPEIYDEIRAGGATRRQALGEYARWVGQIAARFGTRVRYYMISNEVDHDIGYNRPVYRGFRRVEWEEYRDLLRTAHEAIKDVDPGLLVADHGVSAYSLCLAVMADLMADGRPQDAVAFWRAMAYDTPGSRERSLVRLTRTLAAGDSRHRIEFARRSAAELSRYRDVYQLHHYHGPDIVPAVLTWLHAQLEDAPVAQAILAGEVGYLIPAKRGKSWDGRPINVADMTRYSETDHGHSIARTVAALAGHGVEDILYWHIRFHNSRSPAAGLFAATEARDDFRSGYPSSVFAFLARQLSGTVATGTTPGLHELGLNEYRFSGDGELSVAWAGPEAVALSSFPQRPVRVSDPTGAPIPELRIGKEPVVLYWKSPGAAE